LKIKKTARFYNIQKDSTLHLLFRLIAGVKYSIKAQNGQTFTLPQGNISLQNMSNNNNNNIIPKNNTADSQPERKKQKRGSYAKRACNNCRNSHTACDSGRPCKRCVQLGLTDCQDAERKKKRNFEEMEKKDYPSLKEFFYLSFQI